MSSIPRVRYNNFMFVGFFTWWYGDGLSARVKAIGGRLSRVSDFFSVGLLVQTLFTPFRQLSTGSVSGPLSVRLQAVFDNLLSRLIGAGVRSVMIVAALISSLATLVYGVLVVIGWLLLPVLPIVGILVTVVRGGL